MKSEPGSHNHIKITTNTEMQNSHHSEPKIWLSRNPTTKKVKEKAH